MKTVCTLGFMALIIGMLPGCVEEEGPLMKPGENCLRCHGGGDAPRFTVAGTVYSCAEAGSGDGVGGVAIVIKDGSGTEIERLTSNEVGNFYSFSQMPSSFQVSVERNGTGHEMADSPSTGACNSCHSVPPQGDAPGRLYIDKAACGVTPTSALLQN
jgi:hypothetical protein